MGSSSSSPVDPLFNERSQQLSFGLSGCGEYSSDARPRRRCEGAGDISLSAVQTINCVGRGPDHHGEKERAVSQYGLSLASIRHYFVSFNLAEAIAKGSNEAGGRVHAMPTGLIPRHLKIRHCLFLHYVHSSDVLEEEFVAYFYQNTRRVVIAFCGAAAAVGVYSLTQWADKIRMAYTVLQVLCMALWALAVVGMVALKLLQPPLNLMTNQSLLLSALPSGHSQQASGFANGPSIGASSVSTLRHGSVDDVQRWWTKSIQNAKVHEWIVTVVVCANFIFVTSFNGAHGDCTYVERKRRQQDCMEAMTFSSVYVYAISINTFFCQVRFARLSIISVILSIGFFAIVFLDPLVHWTQMYVLTQDLVMGTSLLVCVVSSWLRERSSRNQFELYVERHLQAAQLTELKLRREHLLRTDVPLTAVHSGAVQNGGLWDMGPEVYVGCVCIDGMAQWSQARGPCDTVELIHRLFELIDSAREGIHSSLSCGFSLLRFHSFGDRYLVAIEDDGSSDPSAQLCATLPLNTRLQMILRFVVSCCLGGARVIGQVEETSLWFDYNSALTPREGTHIGATCLSIRGGISVGHAKGFVQTTSKSVMILGSSVDDVLDTVVASANTVSPVSSSMAQRQKSSSLLREALFVSEPKKATVADQVSDPVAVLSLGSSLSKLFASSVGCDKFEKIFGAPFSALAQHNALLALPVEDIDGCQFEIRFEEGTNSWQSRESRDGLPLSNATDDLSTPAAGPKTWSTVLVALHRSADSFGSFSCSANNIASDPPNSMSPAVLATVQISSQQCCGDGESFAIAESNSLNSVRRDGMSSIGTTRAKKSALAVSFDLSGEIQQTLPAAPSNPMMIDNSESRSETPLPRVLTSSAYQQRQLRLIAAEQFSEAIRSSRASCSPFQTFVFPPTEALYRWVSCERLGAMEVAWSGISTAAVLAALLVMCAVNSLIVSVVWCCVGLFFALAVQTVLVGFCFGDWMGSIHIPLAIRISAMDSSHESTVLSLRTLVVALSSLASMTSYCIAVFVAPSGNIVGNSQALWLYIIINASLLSPHWSQPAAMLVQDCILIAAFMIRTFANIGMDPLMQTNMYYLEAEVVVFCFLSRLLTDRARRDTFATDLHIIRLSEEIAADNKKIEDAIKLMAPEGIAASLVERSRRQREYTPSAQQSFWEKGANANSNDGGNHHATVLHLFRSTTITTCTRDIAFCMIQMGNSAQDNAVNQPLSYLGSASKFEVTVSSIVDAVAEVQSNYCAKAFGALERKPTFGVVKVAGDVMMIACAPPYRALGDTIPPDSYDELRCSVITQFVTLLKSRVSLVADNVGSSWSTSLPVRNVGGRYELSPGELLSNTSKKVRDTQGVQIKVFADCQPLLGGILGTSNVTFEYYGGAVFHAMDVLRELPFGSFVLSTRLTGMSDAFKTVSEPPPHASQSALLTADIQSHGGGGPVALSLRCRGSRKLFVNYV